MREYWLPLLTSDETLREFDFRKPNRFDGVVQIIANNAEPIKLALYVTLLCFAFHLDLWDVRRR